MTEPDPTSPTATAVHPPDLVALRSGGGVAVVATTVLASMVAFLDASVVTVAVRAIGEDLRADPAGVQWVVTSYLLTAAALLLLAGSLIDSLGRRAVLVWGLGIMLAASLLCAAAPSVGTLVAARLVQGAGAALVVPSSLALLNGTLRAGDRARGIGVWAGLATFGMTVGPFAGGWLVDHASWRYLFLLNAPLVLAALWALRSVPRVDVPRGRLHVDVAGGVLSTAGLGGVVYALTAGPRTGWAGPAVLAAGLGGVACLAALVPVERRQPHPMLRLRLFASRQFDAINVTTVLVYGALAAAGYLLVLQALLVLGFSATTSGALFIPASVVFFVLSPVVGGLVARIGPRRLMVAGIVSIAAAMFWLSGATAGEGYTTAILPGALLWGLGLGLMVSPLTSGVLASVSDDDLGEASAVNDAAARVGALLMVALVPVLVGVGRGELGPALVDGFRPAMLALGCLALAGAVVAGLFVTDGTTGGPRMPVPPQVHAGAVPVGATGAGSGRP